MFSPIKVFYSFSSHVFIGTPSYIKSSAEGCRVKSIKILKSVKRRHLQSIQTNSYKVFMQTLDSPICSEFNSTGHLRYLSFKNYLLNTCFYA